MKSIAPPRRENPLAMLRRMARPREDVEHCEFCSQPLPARHRHLLETATRKIICSCDACALLFDNVVGPYKPIPRDTRSLLNFRLPDELWACLSLPIDLAFLVRTGTERGHSCPPTATTAPEFATAHQPSTATDRGYGQSPSRSSHALPNTPEGSTPLPHSKAEGSVPGIVVSPQTLPSEITPSEFSTAPALSPSPGGEGRGEGKSDFTIAPELRAGAQVLAFYPSPAGATESLVTPANWHALVSANPALAVMHPDVEALLAHRLRGAREYYLAPIDVCFELVGLIRLHWRGFSGGDKVWQAIDNFFTQLRQTSLPLQVDSSSTPTRLEAAHA